MTNRSLMKVESIDDTPIGAFCNTSDLHYAIVGIANQFWCCEWPLKTGLTVIYHAINRTRIAEIPA